MQGRAIQTVRHCRNLFGTSATRKGQCRDQSPGPFSQTSATGSRGFVARVFFAVLPTVTAGEHRPAQSPRFAYPGGPVDTPRAGRPCFVGRRRAFLRLACGLAVLYPRLRRPGRYFRSAQKNTADTFQGISRVPGSSQHRTASNVFDSSPPCVEPSGFLSLLTRCYPYVRLLQAHASDFFSQPVQFRIASNCAVYFLGSSLLS